MFSSCNIKYKCDNADKLCRTCSRNIFIRDRFKLKKTDIINRLANIMKNSKLEGE